MVEISLESSNDVKTSLSDDNKCNESQLSGVHVHRGLLSSTDLLTNHDGNNGYTVDRPTCDMVKQRDSLSLLDDIEKSSNDKRSEEMNSVSETGEFSTVRDRYKTIRKRKRASWRSDHIRRQRNAKGRISRAEMPYEELLKLREKERIAQQQRRERLRKCGVS